MRPVRVLEDFFAAGVTHLGAESAVFDGKVGALGKESGGEQTHVSTGAREREQRPERSHIVGAEAGGSTAFARC